MSSETATTLPPASVLGIGAVTPLGRTLSDIKANLAHPPQSPGPRRIPDDLLADPTLTRNLRRADRFTRMAVMAASDAKAAAREHCQNIPPERIGIILSSGLGPHCRGFKFLDGMLDEGDAAASPTDFSHSVHGAACAYITALLDLRGPSLTLTDFQSGFHQALLLAQTWLHDNACDRVLLGAVEELGDVLLHCASQMAPTITPGEGALFLVLGPHSAACGFAPLHADQLPQLDPQTLPPTDHLITPFGYSASTPAFHWLATTILPNTPTFPSPGTPGEG